MECFIGGEGRLKITRNCGYGTWLVGKRFGVEGGRVTGNHCRKTKCLIKRRGSFM